MSRTSSAKITLLRLAARHPGASLLLIAVTLVGLGGLAVRAASCQRRAPAPAVASAEEPRTVLNRVWFDRYPRKATDEVQVLLFLAGGLGIHQQGSAFRSTVDVFDFERQKDLLSLTFLQDRKQAQTRFVVTRCDEVPPFNLCLDLASSPRGPRRYYGFGHDEEMAARIPWSARLKQAATHQAQVR